MVPKPRRPPRLSGGGLGDPKAKEPCMESPNQYLSPEPFFARIAPTILRSKGPKCVDYPPPATGTTSTSWAGSMNGCQQAVQVQLQFISVP